MSFLSTITNFFSTPKKKVPFAQTEEYDLLQKEFLKRFYDYQGLRDFVYDIHRFYPNLDFMKDCDKRTTLKDLIISVNQRIDLILDTDDIEKLKKEESMKEV